MKKKILAILLATTMLALVGCGGGKQNETTTSNTTENTETKNDNAIELTLDNYSDYLDVSCDCAMNNLFYYAGGNCGNIITCIARVKATSTNFNYNDVVITVEFRGHYKAFTSNQKLTDRIDFNMPVNVNTDIAGNGENSEDIILEPDTYMYDWKDNSNKDFYKDNNLFDITEIVVDISGYVTPA